ncbi:MAG: hypothetical protein ACKPAF_07260, partial [Actinomycetota bacterium]
MASKKKTKKKSAKKSTKSAKRSKKKPAKKSAKKRAKNAGATVTLGGNPVAVSGKLPSVGKSLPKFSLTTSTLQEVGNKDLGRDLPTAGNLPLTVTGLPPKVTVAPDFLAGFFADFFLLRFVDFLLFFALFFLV